MHLLLRAADAEAAEPCGAATPLRRSLLLGCRSIIDLAVLKEMVVEPQGASRLSVTRVGEVVAAA